MHLVDLDGAKAGRPVNIEAIRGIASSVGIPCQLGGGLRDEASIRLMLDEMGVDRVIVPGLCQGELAALTDAWGGVPVERGPADLRDLPEFFGACRDARSDYGGYDIAILAEINHAVAARGDLVYIRPMPEMNGHWNEYCAYNSNGSSRGPAWRPSTTSAIP